MVKNPQKTLFSTYTITPPLPPFYFVIIRPYTPLTAPYREKFIYFLVIMSPPYFVGMCVGMCVSVIEKKFIKRGRYEEGVVVFGPEEYNK